MGDKLKLILCESYLKETEYVIRSEGLVDIDPVFISSDCMRCALSNGVDPGNIKKDTDLADVRTKEIPDLIQKDKNSAPEGKNCPMFRTCYSILASQSLIDHYHKQGFYILTPGWLQNWEVYIKDMWQFDAATAKSFFNENMKGLILLDSGIYENIETRLKQFSKFVALDHSIIPVGMEYFSNSLVNVYLKWKRKKDEIVYDKQSKLVAELSFMSDMVSKINSETEIEGVVSKMLKLFVMITGATEVAYLRVRNDIKDKVFTYQGKDYNGKLLDQDLTSNFRGVVIKKFGNGFLLGVKAEDNTFDYLHVDNIAMIQRIQEYTELGIKIFKMCSERISNMEAFHDLILSRAELEQESIAKEAFFVNVSHELRTPINIIFNTIQVLEMAAESSPNEYQSTSKKYLPPMKRNCFRLMRLVNNLIDITRAEANYTNLRLTNVNIVNIVEEISQSVAEYAKGKGLSVIFDTTEEDISMAVDVEKVERIFYNLFSNAIKFTPNGGTILTTVSQDGDQVFISVKDTGIGIPEDKIRQIFDRFVQLEDTLIKSHEGSGIGLSMVKIFVEMHGGEVSVHSQIGHGSEFVIKLPIKKVDHEASYSDPFTYMQHNLIERQNIEFSDIYLGDYRR
ncbi:MAG: DUF1638 domain-containing protein [Clostridiales bacterium]|nr:DUF1638 domain-containing protein [Clostridiales bacterium]